MALFRTFGFVTAFVLQLGRSHAVSRDELRDAGDTDSRERDEQGEAGDDHRGRRCTKRSKHDVSFLWLAHVPQAAESCS